MAENSQEGPMDRKKGPKMRKILMAVALPVLGPTLCQFLGMGALPAWAQAPQIQTSQENILGAPRNSASSNPLGQQVLPIPRADSLVPTWPIVSLMPAKVRVILHYSIDAERFTRVIAYREMMAQLKAAGFERDFEEDPDPSEPENSNHILLSGVLPAKSVQRVGGLTAIRSVLAMPEGTDLAKIGESLVRVEMMLGRGSSRVILDTSPATHKALEKLGFKEAGVYDHYLGTRLLGMLPAANLLKVGPLLGQPLSKRENLEPYQPVLVVWADPQAQAVAPLPAPVVIPPIMEKVASELRPVMADDNKLLRVEILFDESFPNHATAIERIGEIAPNAIFEALLGPAVTVVGPVSEIRKFVNHPSVNAIRPGPVATMGSVRGVKDFQPVRPELSRSGSIGVTKSFREGTVIIADDFRGWETLSKPAPGSKSPVRLIDLTCERNPLIIPDAFAGAVNEKGPGTLLAQNILAGAPGSPLFLVRVDPSVPAMILRVAKAINGDDSLTDELMARRLGEIREDRLKLEEQRGILEKDWQLNGDDFGEEAGPLKKRMEYQKALKELEAKEKDHHARLERFLNHQKGVSDLATARLVLCPLVWNEGLPRSGASTLSRWMDDRPFRGALWLQSAGDRPGQSWNGMFRDHDENGVMEWSMLPPGKDAFAVENMPLLFQAQGGEKVQDQLPADTLVRVTVQWREPRDPYFNKTDRKASRLPISDLKPKMVRLEPTKGESRLADRAILGQASGPPMLIDHTMQSAVFESHIFFVVPQTGRYELRIEGVVPNSIIPAGAAQLPINRQKPEIHPVVWLRTFSKGGSVVFSQPGERPVVGVPGDAQSVLSVGETHAIEGNLGAPLHLSNPKPEFRKNPKDGSESSVDLLAKVAQRIWMLHHPDQDVRFWRQQSKDWDSNPSQQSR